MTKLNIGAGDTVIEGFTPIDRKLGSEAYPLAYPDNSVDEIRASHVLEHFPFADVPLVLADWARVLKPGGRMRIAVPDVDKCLGDKTDPLRLRYLMGGQVDENDHHHSAFDEGTLAAYLLRAGLSDVQRWASDNTDTASLPISLNLEATKPSTAQSVKVKISALMSIPRVAWADHWGCVQEALYPFGIPVQRFYGAFWGHCMQRGLNDAQEKGVDWVLCLDYDTVFTKYHLDTLMGHLGNNPEIDAIASLQSRRRHKEPLMTVGDGDTSVAVDGRPIKANTAHFGLTLLRMECLKDVEKPWFKAEPNDEGEWGDGHIDDDIWFWNQWRKAGKTLYVAPDVRIGHLEMMVSQFNESLEHELVTMPEWREQHASEIN